MEIIIAVLIIAVIVLSICLAMLNNEIKSISRQLSDRSKENTRQLISVSLMTKSVRNLAANINKSLKAEEQLRLNAVNEEKKFKEMIADISHDLRTPLTAVKGYQQLIKKERMNEEDRKKLEVSMKHTEQLGNLIEHFFEYSYYLNAEPEMDIKKINITNVVTGCIIDSINSFEEKNIMVNFEEPAPIYLMADEEFMKRIVQNLIRNCLQHSKSDVTVELIKKEKITLCFSNEIDENEKIDADKIFDRFYTADKARAASTGLGLSIVKLLTEKMGGEAKAEVKENRLYIMLKF